VIAKQYQDVSKSIETEIIRLTSPLKLAHYAWMCMFTSILIWGVGIGSHNASSLGNTGNWYRMGFVFLAMALTVIALGKNSSSAMRNTPASIWLLLVYGTVAFFSSQLIPTHAFYVMWKAMEVILDVLIVVAIVGEKRPLDAIWKAYRIIIGFFIFLLCSAWVGAILTPSLAFLPSRGSIPFTIQGSYPLQNGNSLAFVSALVVFSRVCQLFRTKKKRMLNFLLISAAFITLILGQSRTSLVALFVALFVFFYFDKRKKYLLWVAVIGSPAIIYSGFTTLFSDYFMRSQSKELFMSMSGRTHGWQVAWHSFLDNPVFGSGFAAAARTEILGVSGASTLHGAVFDVMVGVGLVGLIPWLTAILISVLGIYRLRKIKHPWMESGIGRNIHAEMIGLFVLVGIRSGTSSGASMHENTFMLLLVLIAYTGVLKKALLSDKKVKGGNLRI